jgi:hypothetical protein
MRSAPPKPSAYRAIGGATKYKRGVCERPRSGKNPMCNMQAIPSRAYGDKTSCRIKCRSAGAAGPSALVTHMGTSNKLGTLYTLAVCGGGPGACRGYLCMADVEGSVCMQVGIGSKANYSICHAWFERTCIVS